MRNKKKHMEVWKNIWKITYGSTEKHMENKIWKCGKTYRNNIWKCGKTYRNNIWKCGKTYGK
jgi:hypothetical protein